MMRLRLALMGLAVLLAARTAAADEYEFTWDTMLLARMHLDPTFSYEDHADSLMQIYQPSVWKLYRNDEFVLADKRRKVAELMKKRAGTFDQQREIVMHTQLDLGKYDFERKAFPITDMNETTRWYVKRFASGDLPRQLHIAFSNYQQLMELPMSESEAAEFIMKRKSRYGSIDRSVHATIRFRLQGLIDFDDEFAARIVSATVYDDRNRTRPLFTKRVVVPAPSKAPLPTE